MSLLLDQLDLLATPADLLAGAPLQLPVASIDEDPDQPRTEFDADALAELAASIGQRGVLQPISVRRHANQPARWVLNFGARRLRACRLAGLTDIPAFIDNAADSYDQVIENEQRDGLKPLELALFVQRRLAGGDSQADIARRLGKSRQYVTMATALIDAPDWLLAAYREGRCRGLNELHELRKLASSHPQYVAAWTSDRCSITRDRVSALRADLCGETPSARPGTSALLQRVAAGIAPAGAAPSPRPDSTPPAPAAAARRAPPARLQLLGQVDGAAVIVDTQEMPPEPGQLYVRPVGGGPAEAVPAGRVTLTGLVAGQGLSI